MRLALRELSQRVQHLDDQLKTVVTRLHRITTQVAPELVALQGVGPDVASALLTAGDNPHRLEREQSFATLCGASPIPAPSGKTQTRHRLNRGGDRHAKAALQGPSVKAPAPVVAGAERAFPSEPGPFSPAGASLRRLAAAPPGARGP